MGFSHVITSAKLSQQLVGLLTEVIEGSGAQDDAREIVRLALSDVVETFDPSDRIQLDLFAHGELADAVETVVGAERVDEIVAYVMRRCEPPRPPPSSGVTSTVFRTEQRPTALVVVESRVVRAEVVTTLTKAKLDPIVCGAYPLDVVSECQRTQPVCVIYDEAASPGKLGRLAKRVRQALGADAPPAIVLLQPGAPPEAVELSGHVGAVSVSRVGRELVPRLQRLQEEPKTPERESARKRPRRHRTSKGVRRRNRRTFDHVLGEALSGIASDRLLKAVLNSALAEAELEELPAKLGPFERFVSGPLRISLTTLLGKQSYDAVTRALTPVLRQAREEVPPRSSGDMVAVKRRMAPTRKHLRCALVMHPDEAEAARISEALETHCTLLLTASCGYRALGMAIKNRPQAVVAALATPNITGAEMIAQLAALLGDEAPPVVIIGDKSAVDGARAVLSEPVDTDELIDVLT